jgi:hypothetical protein
MDKIIAENPNQVFFLCCDTQEAYDNLMASGKFKIIYFKKDVYDRSLAQLRSAVIDLMLLAKTKYILGSNWSSFTEVAKRLRSGTDKTRIAGVDFV